MGSQISGIDLSDEWVVPRGLLVSRLTEAVIAPISHSDTQYFAEHQQEFNEIGKGERM